MDRNTDARPITRSGLTAILKTSRFGRGALEVYPSIGSTNVRARELGKAGGEEGSLIVADEQTAGRGRLGRSFHSPPGSGIYFSIILKPEPMLEYPPGVTLAAGLGVAEGVGTVTGQAPDIKWPNDLLMGDRKICGMITEMESMGDRTSFLILGIGVNVNLREEDIPPEIRAKAGSIRMSTGRAWDREQLLAAILLGVEKRYLQIVSGRWRDVIDEYRRNCVTVGKFVCVRSGRSEVEGKAVGVDDLGRLTVETAAGETLALDSGEVTLSRPVDGV